MNNKLITNLLKGSISTSVGQISTIGFHFLSIMLMTRYMPKEDFGIYLLILLVVHALKILSGLGLDLTLVKFVVNDDIAENNKTFWVIVLVRFAQLMLISILFYSLGKYLLPHLDQRLNDYIIYIPLIVILMSYRELFFFLLQGLRQFKRYAVIQVLSAFTKFLLITAFLLWSGLSVTRLLYVEILTYFLSVIVQLVFIPRYFLKFSHWDSQMFNALLKFGIPLYLNNILTYARERISMILIAAFLNPVSVAYFGVAQKLPEAFARMFKSFIIVYFPNLSKFFSEGKTREARDLLNYSLILSTTVISALVLISFLFKEEIVVLIFSEQYRDAATAFSILVLSFCFFAVSSLMGYSLVSAGYPAVPAKVNSVITLLNFGLSVVLIPKYQYMGAVYAILMMNVSSLIFYSYYLKKIGIRVDQLQYFKPIFAAVVISAGVYIFSVESILLKILLIAVFTAFCWLYINEFRKMVDFGVKYVQKRAERKKFA